MAFDPDAFLSGGAAVAEPPASGFDPDAFLAAQPTTFDPDAFLAESPASQAAPVSASPLAATAVRGGSDAAVPAAPSDAPITRGDNPIGDFFSRIGKSASDSAMDAVTGGLKMAGDMALPGMELLKVVKAAGGPDAVGGINALTNAQREVAKEGYTIDPARDKDLASTVASGIGSLIPTLASGGTIAPLTGAAMMGENARREAEAAGGSALQQESAFYANAVVGALSEKLLGLPALLKSAAAKAIPATTIKEIVNRSLWQAAKSSFREGTQEGIERLAGNLIASEVSGYDPTREAFEGVGEAMLAGAIIGGPLGGTIQAATDISARPVPETFTDAPPVPGAQWRGGEPPPLPKELAPLTADALSDPDAQAQPAPVAEVPPLETTPAQVAAEGNAATGEPVVAAAGDRVAEPVQTYRDVLDRELTGPAYAPAEDAAKFAELRDLTNEFNTKKTTKAQKAAIIEKAGPIRAQLIRAGYDAEFVAHVETGRAGPPLPRPDRPLSGTASPTGAAAPRVAAVQPEAAVPGAAVTPGATPSGQSNLTAPVEKNIADARMMSPDNPAVLRKMADSARAQGKEKAAANFEAAIAAVQTPAVKPADVLSESVKTPEKMATGPRGVLPEADRLRAAISDGEMRLRSKMNGIGEKLSVGEIESTRAAVESARKKLEEITTPARDASRAALTEDAAPAAPALDPVRVENYITSLSRDSDKIIASNLFEKGMTPEEAVMDSGGTLVRAQELASKGPKAMADIRFQGIERESAGSDLPKGGEARADEVDAYMRRTEGKGGFVLIPSAVTVKLAPETSLTPEAYRMGPIAQGVRNWWFGKGGALPKPVRDALHEGRQNIAAVKSDGMIFARDMKLDIDRLTKGMKDKEATRKLVEEVLDGTKSLTDIADRGLRDSVARSRNFIDDLSKTTIDNGIVTGDMADTFRTNMGKWMRRYYSAFDAEAGRTYDTLLKAAYDEPLARSGLKDAGLATVLKNAETEVRRTRPKITDGEVEAVLRGLLDRETMEGVVTGQPSSSRVSKDISSLIRRKEIPASIRAWMGEEKNPLLRFEKSINFMAQLISRHEAQTTIRDVGLTNGLFSTEKTGRYTVEASPDEMTFKPKRDDTGAVMKDADGNPVGEYSTRTDKRMDVFRGLYTTPEFAIALKTLDGGAHGIQQQMGTIGKGLSMFAAETKMAKVPLNPGSWVTNALGGLMMNFANGTATPFTPVKSAKLFSTAFQAMRADRPISMAQRSEAINVQMREMHARLVKEGILNSNITLRDMEASTAEFAGSLLETNATVNRAVGAARLGYYGAELGNAIAGAPGAAVGGAAGAATGAAIGGKAVKTGLQKFSQKSIGTADNFWKVVGYLDNFETYARAYPGKPPLEVARIAAEITRDTMPTYEKIPEGLRSLSKMGTISTFFQFNYEVIRNTFNTVAVGKAELASGNKVLQARGARRLAGAATMIAMASSIIGQKLSSLLVDDDDGEKQKALNRSFVPSWDKNNGLIVTKLGNGSASYVNHGYLVPQAQLTRAMTAAMNGEDAESAIDNIFSAYADDFVSAGVHIGPLIESAVNQKGFRSFLKQPEQGSQVTYKRGAGGYWERFAYVLDKTVKPGAVGEVEKIKKAMTGEQAEYGRKYTLQERAVRMMGLRENTYDLNRTLEFKMRDLQSQWRNAGSVERNIDRKKLPAEQAKKDAAYVKEEQARLKKEMATLKKDAATLGLSGKVKAAQKNAGVALELR